jgi:hypothetical protein
MKYFTANWYILWPFGNVVLIWYIFPCFGTLCQEKSGNPGAEWTNVCFSVTEEGFPSFKCFHVCTCWRFGWLGCHQMEDHGFDFLIV